MKKSSKVAKVMKEFKGGKLHSGSKKGPKKVKSKKQAIAIAMSEAGMKKKSKSKMVNLGFMEPKFPAKKKVVAKKKK